MTEIKETDDGGSIVLLTRRDWWKGVIGWAFPWVIGVMMLPLMADIQPLGTTQGTDPLGPLGTFTLGVISYAIVVVAVYYLGDLRIVPDEDDA